MRRLATLCLLLAGCGSSDPHSGYALEVDVVAGPMVTAEVAARIADVDVTIGGGESFQTSVPVDGELADGGTLSFVYHPTSSPGTMLMVGATAKASDGSGLAVGSAAATLVADQTVRATVTLGGTPSDGGVCTATACTAGDGCCPSGCNATNDSDCAAVCGNGVVEPGEICDDGNTMNGDGCDPTCMHTNHVTVLSGTPGSSSYADRPTGRESRLGIPFAVAIDTAADPNTAFVTESVLGGLVFVVNQPSCMIRQVDLTTGATTTVAGKPFSCFVADGDYKKARFNNLKDLERIGNRLFAIDLTPTGQLIRVVDLTAKTVGTFTLTGVTSTDPSGLGSDGTHLLVLDTGGTRLMSVDPSSGAATVIATSGFGVGTDVTAFGGNYYVAFAGASIYQVTSAGVANAYTNSGVVSAQWLTHDSTTLYASERNHDVLKVVPPATVPGPAALYAGTPGVIGWVDASPATSAEFHYAQNSGPPFPLHFNGGGLATSGGNLFMADSLNSALRKITTSAVSTLAGHPANVADNYGTMSTYVSTAPAGTLTSDGTNLYLAQSNAIRKISLADGSSSQFFVPSVAFDGMVRMKDSLYGASTNGLILRVPLDGSPSSAVAGTVGQTHNGHPVDGCAVPGASCTNPARFNAYAIATDGTVLYILDRSPFANNLGASIRKLDLSTGTISTIAGDPDHIAIVDGTGAAARFGFPQGLTCDGKNLYTLDSPDGQFGTVARRIEIATGAVTTLAGQAGGYGGTDGHGDQVRFAGASDLATDGSSLFIADPGVDLAQAFGPTVRQLDLRTNTVTTVFGVRGQWTSAAGTGTGAYVNHPVAVTYDATTKAFYYYDDVEGVVGRMQ
jgi:cysteine-rich repeat protein